MRPEDDPLAKAEERVHYMLNMDVAAGRLMGGPLPLWGKAEEFEVGRAFTSREPAANLGELLDALARTPSGLSVSRTGEELSRTDALGLSRRSAGGRRR
jgi:hypothetical protein